MLLDPFEKQFDLPASFVQFANCLWRKAEQIGQKNEDFLCLGFFETNTTQVVGIVFIATHVQQRMHLHRRLGTAKRRPWKKRQAQVDGG